MRVLLDGGLTARFDEVGPLLGALVWLLALSALAGRLFHRAHPPCVPAWARDPVTMCGVHMTTHMTESGDREHDLELSTTLR